MPAPAGAGPYGPAALVAQLGGYRDVSTSNPGVIAAAEFAAASVGGELGEVLSAQQQTVAGVNYAIEFTTANGTRYSAVVLRTLEGSYRVTSIDESGDHHTDIAREQAESGDDN